MFGEDFLQRAIIALPAIVFALTVHEYFHARIALAKPVPVDPRNLRGNIRVADFWISAAGPLSNLGLAFLFGMLYRFLGEMSMSVPLAVVVFLQISIIINVSLAFFNLIPLYPLDGSHILRSVLPPRFGETLDRIQPFAPFILIGLIIVGGFWIILGPFISFFVYLFSGLRI
jgi:Zn-dependent protease